MTTALPEGHLADGGGAVIVSQPRDQQLSIILREFASTMITDFAIQSILDHLVKRIVDVLPVTAAGVTLIAPGQSPQYVAASDPSALRYEKLQTELGEGPCTAAHQTGEAIAVPDLLHDRRFPIFAERAREAGLAAVFAFPLCHGEERLGALDLYRDSPGALSTTDMDAAQTLADVAAAYLLNAQTRTDLQASRDQARSSAVHDALTGLPNRTLLERLDHAAARSRRSGRLAGLLCADIDGFKTINDLYGHGAGDELLIGVAQRLGLLLGPGDTLARLSGDEFVILCEDLADPMEADAIAARVVDAVATRFALTDASVQVSVSVGIAVAREEDGRGDQLLRAADTAMYQAKRKGGGRHQIIDAHEQRQTDRRTRLQNDLHGAIGRIAERVETPTQHERLVAIGCDRSQGFHHARPMSVTQLRAHLAIRHP